MPLEIIIPAWRKQTHVHRCPLCKQYKQEANELCRKETGDHTFVCVTCAQDYRRRFGSLSDDILDAYMGSQQRGMVKHVAPDKISDDLDARDEESRHHQHIARPTDKIPLHDDTRSGIAAAGQTQRHEEIFDTAETITWEEAQSEIEAMKKKEEW
jgi:hypothetical protein